MRTSSLLIIILIIITAPSVTAQSLESSGEEWVLAPGSPQERPITAEEKHRYRVRLESGEFLRATVDQYGIDLLVRVFAPDGIQVLDIDSDNGDEGPEPIALEAKQSGLYTIRMESLDTSVAPGRYKIRIDELVGVAAYRQRTAERDAARRAVTGWLKANAIPVRSVVAGSGFADLQPLRRVLKDARIVALGETTHGTREFFQFKHRMVEFLVREMGFRVFTIESSYAACFNINEYIMGRTSDGAAALESQAFWIWNTEEISAMLEWMRAYNASVPDNRKVKFVGFDISINERGREVVLAYLRKVAPERAAVYAELPAPALAAANGRGAGTIDALVDSTRSSTPSVREVASARMSDLRIRYNELLGFLVLNETMFTLRTSAAEFTEALNHARVIAQYLSGVDAKPGTNGPLRDSYMAENLERIVRAEPPGTRVIVWAHNFHISSGELGEQDAPYRRMGWYLRQTFGNEYYALGFNFNKGRFQARNNDPRDRVPNVGMPLTSFKVNPAPDGSVDWHLAQTGIERFIVDLRSASKNRAAAAWVGTPQTMRYLGAVYRADNELVFQIPVRLAKEYDGLVFFDTTTRARPNPSVTNVTVQPE